MQNKGAIRTIAIIFSLIFLYQLSFTLVTKRVEKKQRSLQKPRLPNWQMETSHSSIF